MPKKLTKKEVKALRTKMAILLAGAVRAAKEGGISSKMFEDYASDIFVGGGCPECAHEIVHGEAGPYDRHTCEDW
jgi:hypothetical protein